jgi:hypothetical protein
VSLGATRRAPRTCLRYRSHQWPTRAQAVLWATSTGPCSILATDSSSSRIQSSQRGSTHSSCTTRLHSGWASCQRLCQCPGSELCRPGTIRTFAATAQYNNHALQKIHANEASLPEPSGPGRPEIPNHCPVSMRQNDEHSDMGDKQPRSFHRISAPDRCGVILLKAACFPKGKTYS